MSKPTSSSSRLERVSIVAPGWWCPRLIGVLAFAALVGLVTAGEALAGAAVELELVLAVDASGSVDNDEFALQVRGLAAAFRDPRVVSAIESQGGDGIAVAVMQWSSPGNQIVAVDWTPIADAASAAAFAERIEGAGRLLYGETAIAHALRFATGLFVSGAFEGRRKVIDLSGDGPNNYGGMPTRIRDLAVAAGMTINGLAILNEYAELDRYYQAEVIGGPGAFVMTAADYADFAAAIRNKLVREISGPPIASARCARLGHPGVMDAGPARCENRPG